MSGMKIVCCMLTRNNEASLAKAVRSVMPHLDDIVIVDTGSEDGSVQTARELGARVYEAEWNDHFGEARNISLKYADGADWVLVIDADEEFVWKGETDLKEWLASLARQTVVAFECRHYETKDDRMLAVTHVDRLFSPRHYRYEGGIHEKLVAACDGIKRLNAQCPFASFRHVGYSSEFHLAKSRRNMRILGRELQARPSDGRIHRYLAAELHHVGSYIECIEYANSALSLLAGSDAYSRAQAHYFKIMACLHLEQGLEAEQAIRASVEDLPSYPDPYAIQIEICYSERRWEEAYAWYRRWEREVARQTEFLPDHCGSRVDVIRRHGRIAAVKAKKIEETFGKEVREMKVAILIVHPQLEADREELLEHLSLRFKDMPYEIGLWSKPSFGKDAKNWPKRSRIRWVEEQRAEQAGAKFAAACRADILWIWHPNERLASEWDEETFAETIACGGDVLVRAYSDRLGCEWTERRIRVAANSGIADPGLSLSRGTAGIIVERPFVVSSDKRNAYREISLGAPPIQRMLVAFACQRYQEVLDMRQPPDGAEEWPTFQFYRILALINLGRTEEASECLYNAMEAELGSRETLDFVYLYGKLAANAEMDEMKREALGLLVDTLKANPVVHSKHVRTTESDWLSLIAELQWQTGDRLRALVSWRQGLESSGYTNERCVYRLAGAIYETHAAEGHDRISRAIMEAFPVDSPAAQSMLSPIFSYLNMPEWSALFARSREGSLTKQAETTRQSGWPLVSLILPVYNDTLYLFESIRAILAQTYLELELVVVDDGSDDDVAAIVRRFAHDSRVKYYRLEKNRGLPHALNYGLSKAEGSLMGWTSADNGVQPRWLERMVQTLAACPDASAVFSDYYHIDKDGLAIETKRLSAYRLNGLQNGGPSLLWKASAYRKSGGFDESLFGIEDRDFAIRLALVGRFVHLQEPLYYYRIHEGSLSSRIDSGFAGGWPRLHEKLKRKWLHLSFV
ncbi:glycosyltransferase [Cohnella sp. LGH]|uniref:glycosyltransferase n=1 Tax=Cohnella sp. LGH TaxID=1619153 RepID=UPI001ADA4C6F|nr:glycosyltransferase [Cohnella sp. LGH]QTH42386.1 glycosyltransferase [Cohnella sp. LGH]